ncbi:MAG: hypothetical protein HOA08_10605 [Rhodospirillaceae bacterium]|jgi:hypothetical protein|nr:hypothetical protein [Rhodospirillaceae bacterium]MBT3494341.1 hypothetical protein [Rhodospirillaceae bacterium]MBT3780395.1 hypothetical protein [Rhodospirillaceae bacterium]MBT3979118.1 hypothetical protein [Rhodospirillaceae bacterium]MBT4167777.1 hypothetical protein [Rhodospirillaceae bacterium]
MKHFLVHVAGRGVMERLVRLMAGLHQHFIVAILFRLLTRRMPSDADQGGHKRYHVLMIDKDTFYEDVHASLGASREVRVYVAHRVMVKSIAAAFLPPELDDNFYVSDDPKTIQAKRNYGAFLTAMWPHLTRLLRIDAVVSANFGYYAEREFAGALEAMGVPFLALHKENLKSPGRMDFFADLYRARRGPFTGRRILVYNEIERIVQTRAEVIAPDRVTICGMPRLDRVHYWRRHEANGTANDAANDTVNNTGRKQVLFFSFTTKTGLPQIRRKSRSGFANLAEPMDDAVAKLSWETLFRDSHRALYRLAQERPDVDVVIKTKPRPRDYDPVIALLGDPATWPENLKLVYKGDPFKLMITAHTVCGFNTTGLFEAITAGKTIVVPRFAEALDPAYEPFIVDYEAAASYATSGEDLTAKLQASLEQPVQGVELAVATKELLDKWTGNPDGKASERVTKAVLSEIDASRNG